MLATGLSALAALFPLFLGGAIGPLQLVVLVLLLPSSVGIFLAVSKEMDGSKAFGVAAGIYLIAAIWTLLVF